MNSMAARKIDTSLGASLSERDLLLSPSSAQAQTVQSKREVKRATTKLLIVTGLCFVFMTIEVIGGILAGSLAIMTDAAHLFSDIAGFLVSIFALTISDLAATHTLSYGYRRAEVLGALFSVVLIWVLTLGLVLEACNRIHHILTDTREHFVDGRIMTIIALFGVACNLVIMKVLGHSHAHGLGPGHGHSHGGEAHNHANGIHEYEDTGRTRSHSHSHSHGHGHGHEHKETGKVNGDGGHGHGHEETGKVNDDGGHDHANVHGHSHGVTDVEDPCCSGKDKDVEKGKAHAHTQSYGSIPLAQPEPEHNINVSAAYIHALGDLVLSVGVCIAGGIIWLFPGEKYPMVQLADPAATLLFSVIVIVSTWSVLRTAVTVLMQGVPEGVDAHKVCRGLESVEGVVGIHHLHIWSITIGEPSLSVHVQVAHAEDMNPVLKRLQHYLRRNNFHHSTVQIEVFDESFCSPDCDEDCKDYALRCHDGDCHTYRDL